jgi:hypothetical protein
VTELAPPAAYPPRPRWLLVIMILLSIGYAGMFVLSALMVLTSPFVFDSGDNARNWSAFFMILLSPLVAILSTTMGWYGYARRRYGLIPLGLALPAIYVAIFWFTYS